MGMRRRGVKSRRKYSGDRQREGHRRSLAGGLCPAFCQLSGRISACVALGCSRSVAIGGGSLRLCGAGATRARRPLARRGFRTFLGSHFGRNAVDHRLRSCAVDIIGCLRLRHETGRRLKLDIGLLIIRSRLDPVLSRRLVIPVAALIASIAPLAVAFLIVVVATIHVARAVGAVRPVYMAVCTVGLAVTELVLIALVLVVLLTGIAAVAIVAVAVIRVLALVALLAFLHLLPARPTG
jgi:hypothetical protein